MRNILQQVLINKDSVYLKLNKYLEQIAAAELINILDNVNEDVLYISYFHGLHHSQKVCLFTYLICKKLNVNEVDTKILIDAALYHDIGRINESEDPFHGYNTARKIDSVVTDPIYKDEINLLYLKAICEAHSLDDSKLVKIFQNYKYENSEFDFDRFNMLCNILKDADALDRTRFKKACSAALKEKFLRLDYSRNLVEFSDLINSHFAFKVSEQYYEENKDQYEGKDNKYSCFHGIGFDFFKLESILKNGILSKFQATKENVDMVRNFNGNNKNIWISVVDSNGIDKDGKAYNDFIKPGISFYAFTSGLNKGTSQNKNSSYNTAYNSGEYEDESFVFNKIPVSNIHSLIIFKDNWNKNISELFYLYGNNNYDIIYEKVISYIVNIKKSSGLDVDFSNAEILLKEYRKEVIKFEKLPGVEQKRKYEEFFKVLEDLTMQINKEVQQWLLAHYKCLLNTNRDDIKVSEVISFILKNEKVNISDIYNNKEEIMFVLNPILERDVLNKTF